MAYRYMDESVSGFFFLKFGVVQSDQNFALFGHEALGKSSLQAAEYAYVHACLSTLSSFN